MTKDKLVKNTVLRFTRVAKKKKPPPVHGLSVSIKKKRSRQDVGTGRLKTEKLRKGEIGKNKASLA